MENQAQPKRRQAPFEPEVGFQPPPTRPGLIGFLVILAVVLSPFLATNLPHLVDMVM